MNVPIRHLMEEDVGTWYYKLSLPQEPGWVWLGPVLKGLLGALGEFAELDVLWLCDDSGENNRRLEGFLRRLEQVSALEFDYAESLVGFKDQIHGTGFHPRAAET